MLDLMSQGAAIVFAIGVASLVVDLARIPALEVPTGGVRGMTRARALESSLLFAYLEPVLLRLGGWIRELLAWAFFYLPWFRERIQRIRVEQERALVLAGRPGGLSVESFWAVVVLTGCAGGLLGLWSSSVLGSQLAIVVGLALGLWLPLVHLAAIRAQRFTEAARELPASIDLTALAMNAGADFPGALRRVVAGQTGVVADELRLVQMSIDLGVTRAESLRALEVRLPIVEVRDLVRAVVLAEQKGASVTEVMAQQAMAARQRRSVRAEEAAARAGVLLMGPMMLLVLCVLILLVGPMMITGIGF